MDADGSNVQKLTNITLPKFRSICSKPRWSPNGKQIAFVSERDGNFEIYVMNADGGNVRRLTNNPGVDFYPSWCPLPQLIK
jgi:TolB protein